MFCVVASDYTYIGMNMSNGQIHVLEAYNICSMQGTHEKINGKEKMLL